MRKLFWCGCAALMVCAVGVFWAAQWGERHPQAPMAGCARLPWQLLTDWNPIVQVGRAMGAQTLALFQGPKPPPTAGLNPAVRRVAAPADPGVGCSPPITEVIDISTTENTEPPSGHYVDRRPEYIPPSPDYPLERELAYMQKQQVETVLPGDIEEAEHKVPDVMPAADEDDTRFLTPIAYPKNTLNQDQTNIANDAEELPMPRVEDADEEDVDAMPAEDVKEEIPMPDEDEYQIRLDPPGPQRLAPIEAPEVLARGMAAELSSPTILINVEEELLQTNVDSFGLYGGQNIQEPELLPMPHEEELDPVEFGTEISLQEPVITQREMKEASEESEAMQNGKPPDCQEVPNIEQRCPECPAGGPR